VASGRRGVMAMVAVAHFGMGSNGSTCHVGLAWSLLELEEEATTDGDDDER